MSSGDVKTQTFGISLLAGASAGLAVDVTLYPLDTIKTRLQSKEGFLKKGGFKNIYAGIGSCIVGSAPSAAAFFVTYDMFKSLCCPHTNSQYHSLIHMTGASLGELVSCFFRVPVEIVKQRTQTYQQTTSWQVLRYTIKTEGFPGLYRGYSSTVLREIPFSLIQLPIWEKLKHLWLLEQKYSVTPWQSSICGAVAGAISAAITTPLDVAKTRIMLAERGTRTARGNICYVLKNVYKTKGMLGLFSGVVPRVLWISVGGAIFFGAYEKTKFVLLAMEHSS